METAARGQRWTDLLFDFFVWAMVGIVFWPATRWLLVRAMEFEQLGHAVILLAFAAVMIARDRQFPWTLRFTKLVWWPLGCAFALLLVAVFAGLPVVVFPALVLALVALFEYAFGRRAARFSWAFGAGVGVFVLLALCIQRFDMPLRAAAAGLSSWMLGLLGRTPQLGILPGEEPKLILAVGEQFFEVAAECNGFGLMSGSLLLAVLFALYRRIGWLDAVLLTGTTLLLAYFINGIRILLIVLLAPHAGERYFLMHEAVGIITMFAGLWLVWWLVSGLPSRDKSQQTFNPSRPRRNQEKQIREGKK